MQIAEGMVAVITGAGSGIGRALAEHAAGRGMRVAAADVEEPALAETVDAIRRDGGTVIGVPTDVTSAAEVERLAETVWRELGGVDLLCNNAGVFVGGLLWERTTADWDWVLGVNLRGLVHAVQSFVPRMLDAGTAAHIVNTASMGGLITNAYSGPYYTSKFAAVGLTDCLAHDLQAVGAPIAVSVLVPSLVRTRIAGSERNRPERWIDRGRERGDDEAFVLAAIEDATTGAGMAPSDVAALVFDAVEADRFWIPTKPSYHDQIRSRHEDMQALRHPAAPHID